MVRVRDRHPATLVKRAVLAKSGVYWYTRQEMIDRGHTPKTVKPLYSEYRPPEVVARAKDLFPFAVVTAEHTEEETDESNVREQFDGVVGDTVEVSTCPDGNVELLGNIAMYTRDGKAQYDAGNRETSADYRSVVAISKNPEYDFELKEILSVNGVALTARGRGGRAVRVLDKAPLENLTGGLQMKEGIFARWLGLGRTQDKAFKLSKVLLDGLKESTRVKDDAKRKEIVDKICAPITELSESDDRQLLIGAVKDSFENVAEVLANSTKVEQYVDTIFDRARTKDAEDMEKLSKDLDKKKDETEEEKKAREAKELEDGKGSKTKDGAPTLTEFSKLIDERLSASEKRTKDSIQAMIDESLKKTLGVDLKNDKGQGTGDSRTIDSAEADVSEGSFVLDDAFRV